MGRKDKRRKRVQQFVRDKNKVAANVSMDRHKAIIDKLVNETTPLIDKKANIEDEIQPMTHDDITNDDTVVNMDTVNIQLSASKSNYSYHSISHNAEVPKLDLDAINNVDPEAQVNDTDVCDNTVFDTSSLTNNNTSNSDGINFDHTKPNSTRQYATLISIYLITVCVGMDQINLLLNSGFISSHYKQLINNVQIPTSFLLGISLIWHIPIHFDAKYLIIFSTLIMSVMFYLTSVVDQFNSLLWIRFILGMTVGLYYVASDQLIKKIVPGKSNCINFYLIIGSIIASLVNCTSLEWFLLDKIICGLSSLAMIASWLVLPYQKATVNQNRLPKDLLICSLLCVLTKCIDYTVGSISIVISVLLFILNKYFYHSNDKKNGSGKVVYNNSVNYLFTNMIKTINVVSILYIISLHANIVNYEKPTNMLLLLSIGSALGYLLSGNKCLHKYSLVVFIITLSTLFLTHWFDFTNLIINGILILLTSSTYAIMIRSKIKNESHESIDHISIVTYMIIGLIICHSILHFYLGVILKRQLLQLVDQDHTLRQILQIYHKSLRSIYWIYKRAPSFAYDMIVDCYDDMFKVSTVLVVLEIISIVFALVLLV